VNAELFLADLEAKPAALRELAGILDAGKPWAAVPGRPERVVFLGMGSSRFAASVAAARLRGLGFAAVAEPSSAEAGAAAPGGPGTLAVAISASGKTVETAEALRRHRDAGSATLAVTNAGTSAMAAAGTGVVDLAAGPEGGGVACRTFQHTLALLLALEDVLAGGEGGRAADLVRRAATATEDLLDRRSRWLPDAVDIVTSAGQAFVIGPHERFSSAEQGALMLREGPRIPASACETGDWLHVDVYLTKSLDYRALLFVGSRFDPEVMGWVRERGSKVVAVGGGLDGAAAAIRYRHDDEPDVALLTEVLVPELIAATAWGRSG
jgi:fructoselysine-6-P-deglycase FrlB-like protein